MVVIDCQFLAITPLRSFGEDHEGEIESVLEHYSLQDSTLLMFPVVLHSPGKEAMPSAYTSKGVNHTCGYEIPFPGVFLTPHLSLVDRAVTQMAGRRSFGGGHVLFFEAPL